MPREAGDKEKWLRQMREAQATGKRPKIAAPAEIAEQVRQVAATVKKRARVSTGKRPMKRKKQAKKATA